MNEKIILDIGTEIEIDPIAGFRVFICASSGYGKSYLAAKLVEELLSHNFLVVIFDTEGEYYTLREKFDLLVVGTDVPLDLESADIYADLLLEKNMSLIFDFANAGLGDIEAQEFFAKFSEIVFQLENKYRKPVIFVVEEAEVFAPQQGRPPSLIPANKISKRGRKRGIHSIWITQRPADFNKMILSQCNMLFVGRVTHERDIKALEPYIGPQNISKINKLPPSEKILAIDGKTVLFEVARRVTSHGAETPLTPLNKKSTALKDVAAELVSLLNQRIQQKEKEKKEIDKLKMKIKQLTRELQEKEKEIDQLKTALLVKKTLISTTVVEKSVSHTKKTDSELMIPKLPTVELKVLQYLQKYPALEFTLNQIARGIGLSPKGSRIRTALARLKRLNLIIISGKKYKINQS